MSTKFAAGEVKAAIMSGAKKLSAGNLFLADVCCIGETVLDQLNRSVEKKKLEERELYERLRREFYKMTGRANSIKVSKPDHKSWLKDEIYDVLKTYQRSKQGIPSRTKKEELRELYEVEVEAGRLPLSLDEFLDMNGVAAPDDADDSDQEGSEDEESYMECEDDATSTVRPVETLRTDVERRETAEMLLIMANGRR